MESVANSTDQNASTFTDVQYPGSLANLTDHPSHSRSCLPREMNVEHLAFAEPDWLGWSTH
ncbi:hypothetical protein BDY19DRAFT_973432 [Irpex rosettiformis]|uniref:Uncharacterized protein n=1 Tax=Irpex rosettiformis TaxID=378272 RepID=A0ACB8TQH1_9APHY|nr:hypothetical protein BDY19DRAFT_973432 [Irpex rosettiformis]